MLGFGHNPTSVSAAAAEPQVMANIMTPSLEHADFMEAIRAEVGHSRDESCPRGHYASLFGDNCPCVPHLLNFTLLSHALPRTHHAPCPPAALPGTNLTHSHACMPPTATTALCA